MPGSICRFLLQVEGKSNIQDVSFIQTEENFLFRATEPLPQGQGFD